MEPQRPDLGAALTLLRTRHPSADNPLPTYDDDREPMIDYLAMRRSQEWREAIPSRFVDASLDDLGHLPPKLCDELAEWAASPRGRNVLLWGSVGVGKTHAAVALARPAHFERSQDVLFRPVVELLDELRDEFGTEGRGFAGAEARDVDLLVLDDVGGEKPTDWTAERLYAVINRRWLEERPIVATTNLPLTERVVPPGYDGPVLEDVLGARTFSRLVGNGALVRRLSGPDRRR